MWNVAKVSTDRRSGCKHLRKKKIANYLSTHKFCGRGVSFLSLENSIFRLILQFSACFQISPWLLSCLFNEYTYLDIFAPSLLFGGVGCHMRSHEEKKMKTLMIWSLKEILWLYIFIKYRVWCFIMYLNISSFMALILKIIFIINHSTINLHVQCMHMNSGLLCIFTSQ